MINHCINNHTSMMAGCQVSGATLTMGVTWGHPVQVACSYLLLNNDLCDLFVNNWWPRVCTLLTSPSCRA
jgi:hypothetical protein